MDKYVAALGGHDAIYKHKSMTVRGSFELSPTGPNLDRIAYFRRRHALCRRRTEVERRLGFAVSQGVETLLSKQGR
jgi:hypothetical protein